VPDARPVFLTYREVRIRDDEIAQGLLLPGLAADDPEVRALIDAWGGRHFVRRTALGDELTLVRRTAPPPAERWWLHVLLFVLTLVTATAAGARFLGREPFPLALAPAGPIALPVPVGLDPAALWTGLVFSVPLIAILLGHELGHYLLARRHGVDVSPPYFIPSPRLNAIGTFGAFIRLRSPIVNRAVLLDVGAAGPLVSFVLSLPVLVVGLMLSTPARFAGDAPPTQFAVYFGNDPIFVGGSLIVHAANALLGHPGDVLILHPLAFAGWLGLFVTALNLVPLSQLDGGHILYALVRGRQPAIGVAFLAMLVALGAWWPGWWVWAVLILLLGRGTIRHPPVFDAAYPLDRRRRRAGWACVAIFVLTFVVVPFRF
jgi:Zn-dependent protease